MANTSRRQFLTAAAGVAVAPTLFPGMEIAAAPQQIAGMDIDWGYPEDAVRVGLNENPLGVSPKAAKAMVDAVQYGNRYLRSGDLTDKIARLHGVDANQIVFGCGSTELLTNVPWAFAQDGEIVTGKQAYRDLPAEAGRMGITAHMVPLDSTLTHDLDAMADAINDKTRVVNLTNPNNPTGTVVGTDDVRKFAAVVPKDAVYLIDEAYIHFAPEADSSALVHDYDNVLVLRTFSKIFGMAGIRVGYGIGHPDLIGKMRRYSVRNNVSVVGFAGALAAMDDTEHMDNYRALLRESREYYQRELTAMGVEHYPSRTPFFVLNAERDGSKVVEELQEHNVFIRRGNDWDLPTFVRVTFGKMDDNRKTLAALKKVLGKDTMRRQAG